MNPPPRTPCRTSDRVRPALAGFLAQLMLSHAANAAVVEAASPNLGWTLPDDSTSGLLHSLTLGDPGIVQSVSVRLRLSVPEGGSAWLGDLYVHLEHASGISVLMNRVGRSGSLPFGYADRGAVDVVFSDAASLGDIHRFHDALAVPESAALDSTLTGTWQPDGRATDPATVLTSSARTASLATFAGHAVAGDWNLFLADLSGGGQHRLEQWSLTFDVDVSPVPEPAHATGLAVGLLGAGLWARRLHRSRRNSETNTPSSTA